VGVGWVRRRREEEWKEGGMGRFNSDKHDVCGRLSGAYFFPPSILY